MVRAKKGPGRVREMSASTSGTSFGPRGTASGSGATSRVSASICRLAMLVRISQSSGGDDRGATSTIGSDGANRAASFQAASSGSSSRAAKTEISTGYRAARPVRSATADCGPVSALQTGFSRTRSRTAAAPRAPGVATSSVMAAKTNAGETGHNQGVSTRPRKCKDQMAHRNVERVARVLEAVDAEITVRELDASTRTAGDAAGALGCEVGAIANSLVFMTGTTPVLVMTSGAHRVDLDL